MSRLDFDYDPSRGLMLPRERRIEVPRLVRPQFGVVGSAFFGPPPAAATDPYWDYVELLLLFREGAGASTFLDSSKYQRTVTTNGSVVGSSTANQWGVASCASFPGSPASLNATVSSINAASTTPWTVEVFAFLTLAQMFGAGGIFGWGAGGASVYVDPYPDWRTVILSDGSTNAIMTGALAAYADASTWKYYAFQNDGSGSATAYTAWYNGNRTATSNATLASSAQTNFQIGKVHPSSIYFSGLMGGLRYTRGVARLSGATCVIPTSFPVGALLPSRGVAMLGKGNTPNGSYRYEVYKYNLGSDAVTAGTSLNAGHGADGCAGTGTTTTGYWYAGYAGADLTYTDKYTFSGDVQSTGATLTTGGRYFSAAGNATVGISAGSFNAGNTNKYTYAGDTCAAGTALTREGFLSGACGNATRGIWAGSYSGGSGTVNTGKYTYSGDTTANGTACSVAHYGTMAMATATVGYFQGDIGSTNTLDKYTFAADTVATGTSTPNDKKLGYAACDPTSGIFVGGGGSGIQYLTAKYTFAGDVVAAGTNLGGSGTSYTAGAACSTVPGGF